MFTLEEMTTITPAMQTVRGFKELLNGIAADNTLDDIVDEELYNSAAELFNKALTEILRNRVLLLWSDLDGVSIHVLKSSEECERMLEDAERLFAQYPIENTNDPEIDKVNRNNRFVCKISFKQFCELTGSEFANPDNYSVSECGLEYCFEDQTPIINARANGKL